MNIKKRHSMFLREEVPLDNVENIAPYHVQKRLRQAFLQLIKRGADLLGASVALLLFLPAMLITALVILVADGRPVFFIQERIGRHGEKFRLYKFRTMTKNADSVLENWKLGHPELWHEYVTGNFKLKNDPRLLRCGAWLRSYSIDELPQIFNVLQGDMSMVGPRPLLERELPDYGADIALYKQIRPGITGLWQISGRSHTSFRDRANFDAWYAKHWSLWCDFLILLKTVKAVLKQEGAC